MALEAVSEHVAPLLAYFLTSLRACRSRKPYAFSRIWDVSLNCERALHFFSGLKTTS